MDPRKFFEKSILKAIDTITRQSKDNTTKLLSDLFKSAIQDCPGKDSTRTKKGTNRTVPNVTAGQLMDEVCAYLSKVDPQIEVWPNLILNRSTESTASGKLSVIL